MEKPRGLNLILKLGKTVVINEVVTMTITEVTGNNVRVCISAPDNFKITRSDIYCDHVEEKNIQKALKEPSIYKIQKPSNTGSNFIKFTYGRYSGSLLTRVPTYFLRYVLSEELSLDNSDNNHNDLLIAELERRKNQGVGSGEIKNNLH